MNESPKPKTGWRIVRRILIVLAVIVTLIAIFYTEEDWRGKHAWENYRHEWEAKGEKFNWRAFVPPPVPDDQNFFTAPIFTNMLDGKILMTPYGQDVSSFTNSGGDWQRASLTDLKAWQTYYRESANAKEFPIAPQPQTPAADVLLALSKYDSAIEELRQASQRPYSNVPIKYEDGLSASASILLPYLATVKRCTQVLQLRTIAKLDAGQGQKALDDWKLLLFFGNSLRTQPFLISELVRMAVLNLEIDPVWEGLAEHQWTDEQLATIETELGKLDFLADYELSMRCERAFAIQTFENQRITRQFTTWDDALATNIVHNYYFMPGAFFYQNELAFARVDQQWLLPLVDMKNRIISPATLRSNDLAVRAQMKHYSPYKIESLRTFSIIGSVVKKFAFAQTTIDLARVGCALERYHLAHGEYPDSLDALAPQFIEIIPNDIINDEPLHYRRTSEGKFLLYSVGWNDRDDGGLMPSKKNGGIMGNCDWVWPATAQ